MATKGSPKAERGAKTHQDDVDELFKLPLGEFTVARNALAGRLKKNGQSADAEAVKALPKPSVAAWAVNQLYWRNREDFDRLIDTGERFRRAQAAHLAGKSADVRAPLNARREALSALARVAADTLKSGGYSATPDMMRRITTTLEALSTYGSLPAAPHAGRLTDDVEPPGFETLAALVPRIGEVKRESDEGPTRVLPFRSEQGPKAGRHKETPDEAARRREEERQAEVAGAKTAVQEAERALRDARKKAEQAEAALKRAATHAKDVERQRAEIEKRFAKVRADADAAHEEARRVAADAEEAAQGVEDAERALDQARRQLQQLV